MLTEATSRTSPMTGPHRTTRSSRSRLGPRAWIAVVMRRLLVDQLRRQRVACEVSADLDGAVVAAEPDAAPWWHNLEIGMLQQQLGRLSPDLRKTFELYSFGARSYKQIARELDIATPTVGSRINRARLLLRRWLIERAGATLVRGANGVVRKAAPHCDPLDCI